MKTTATYKILARDFDEETDRRRVIRTVELIPDKDDRKLLEQLRWNRSQLDEVYAIVRVHDA